MKKDEIFDALETLDFPRDSYIVIGGACLFFLRRVILICLVVKSFMIL